MDEPLSHRGAMAAKFMSLQFIKAFNHSCTNRVQVNIPHQFPQIGLFLTDNGFVAILKQLTAAAISPVKPNNIAREEASHESGQGLPPGTEKKMGMIG